MLRWLDLGLNQFSSTLPSTLGHDLKHLRSLRLDANRLEGPIPQSLSFLTDLKFLDVSMNMLTSLSFDTESVWRNMTELKILDIAGNFFSGTIPASLLSSLSALEVFHFSDNFFEGSMPTQIASLQSLLSLDGGNNNLQGPIPWSNISRKKLTELDLSSNSLTGIALPSDIGHFSKLKELYLSNNFNFLESSMPESIGELSQLEKLNLASTRLIGELPSHLGTMQALRLLDLSSNSLQGSLKTELASLQNLTLLRLDTNSLSGTVPTAFLQLTALSKFMIALFGWHVFQHNLTISASAFLLLDVCCQGMFHSLQMTCQETSDSFAWPMRMMIKTMRATRMCVRRLLLDLQRKDQ